MKYCPLGYQPPFWERKPPVKIKAKNYVQLGAAVLGIDDNIPCLLTHKGDPDIYQETLSAPLIKGDAETIATVFNGRAIVRKGWLTIGADIKHQGFLKGLQKAIEENQGTLTAKMVRRAIRKYQAELAV